MDDGNSWMGILLFGAAFVVYYLVYGFGAAVQALNTSVLEDERDEGNTVAEKLLHIQENPHRFIRTNQLITMVFSLAMGAFSLPYAVRAMDALLAKAPKLPFPMVVAGISYVLALVLLAVAFVCFGIIIPKWLALNGPIRFCKKVLPVVEVMMTICTPFTVVMETVSHLLLKLMGIDTHAYDEKVTEEDIRYMVNEGHDQGLLEASEAEMISNIFEFDDKVASDIMTHRMDIVALDGAMTLQEAIDFIIKDAINSRFPVYEEDIDSVIGILYLRDALVFAEIEEYLSRPISEIDGLLREACFVHEGKNINALFKEMQSAKIHMEIVLDEFGQTSGLVSMEDIIEEIVGNILDEYDDDEEEDIVSSGNDTFLLTGLSLLEDVEETLEMEFDERDKEAFDTLNGVLTCRLGHLPGEDERAEITYGGYIFKITEVESRRIKSVEAKRIPVETKDSDESLSAEKDK